MTDKFELSPLSDENEIFFRTSPHQFANSNTPKQTNDALGMEESNKQGSNVVSEYFTNSSTEVTSNNPNTPMNLTTTSNENQFTSPLKTLNYTTPPSFLQKTPLLCQLLSNSTNHESNQNKSAALLCEANSQLRFTQEENEEGMDGEEEEEEKEEKREKRKEQTKQIEAMSAIIDEEKEEVQDETATMSTFRVVSISMSGNKIGVATMDFEEGKLEVTTLYGETNDYSTIDCYIFQSGAKVIITHSRIPTELMNHLKSKEIEIEIVPTQEFTIEACKKYFEIIPVPFIKNQNDENSILVSLSTHISFETNNELTKAVGGVLFYYYQYILKQPENERNQFGIKEITSVQWDTTLQIDESALNALYIFKKEQHPDIHSKGGAKEGISLYGCLNKCMTSGGSKLLKEWMLRIRLDRYIIEERHEFQRQFNKEKNKTLIDSIRKLLRRANDFSLLCTKMKMYKMNDRDWIKLYRCVCSINQIICLLAENSFEHRVVVAIENRKELIVGIKNCFEQIFEMTRIEENELEIAQGFNEEYDGLMEELNGLNSTLNEYHKKFNRKYCFFAKMGFMIEIKKKEGYDEKWKMMFKTKECIYFKDEHCIELDQNIGDIQQQVEDAKTVILDDLTKILNESMSDYPSISSEIFEFDVLLDFVVCDIIYNWNLPLIVKPNEPLILTEARNPIIEMVSDVFVPNNTTIDSIPIHIITGPNCSGKSVYLRQVGINVFMGLLGCGISATYGEIPLFKRICTRMSTRESSQNCLSAFTIDCSQLSTALRHVDNESLLLIDEFGKGTHPSDEAALFISTIRFLQSLGNKTPKTIISTHFISIFNRIDINRCVPLKMDVISNVNDNNIRFLYRLVSGITDSSYGIHCAKIARLPPSVIQRASQVADCLQTNTQILPKSSLMDLEKYYNFLVSLLVDFDTQGADLDPFLTSVNKIASHLANLQLKPN